MTAQRFFTHPYGIAASASACALLWGSAFPAIKASYAALDIRPEETSELLWFAGIRFFLASLLILGFLRVLNEPVRLRRAALLPMLRVGAFQTFLQYCLFYFGLSLSTGSQGAVISGTTSFFQMLFAHMLYKDDKLSARKIAGLFIGFAGVAAVNITEGASLFRFGVGEACLLAAMAAAGIGNVFAKEESASIPVAYLTGYQMLFGAVGLMIAGTAFGGVRTFHFVPATAGLLAYLAVLSAAGFVLWNTIMKYNRVGNVSMYLFLIPVFGVALSSMLLNEPFHLFVLLGLLLVAAGIVIVHRKRPAEEPKVGHTG